MRTKRILIATLFTVPAFAAIIATAALATPSSGFTTQLLGRGAAQDEFQLMEGDASRQRTALAKCGSDFAVVRATLQPNGFTGWHSHPMNSLIVVAAGSFTMYELEGGRCSSRTFTAGQAFVHPAGTHNFVNSGSVPSEFVIAYFAPVGAGLLIDNPAPAECP
jgi:quercetin dioxygenase-like cupin family protein